MLIHILCIHLIYLTFTHLCNSEAFELQLFLKCPGMTEDNNHLLATQRSCIRMKTNGQTQREEEPQKPVEE